jgi:O-methyltransferase
MSLSSLALKYLGRERVADLASYSADRLGIVVNTPMRSLEATRNRAVLRGEYIRASSLELVAREINEKDVGGAVAELGVYRGDFAKLINAAFPNRTLYLFDTFTGFDKDDLKEDARNARIGDSYDDFTATSIALVLSKMEHKARCVVMPGIFPQSAQGCTEDRFAFVSIDCDLYRPIYEGLQYFYPKLSSGGYIFVHDYNNACYQGAKQAVRQFASEQAIAYFPLTDSSGSAVFAKA